MNLKLIRTALSDKSTIGELLIDGVRECYTLEDVVRPDGEKVYGKTAIPAGKYEVVITFSNRFKCLMPLLLHVPGFEGIRIHSGNTAADTHGCVLTGRTVAPDFIGESKAAYAALYPKLEEACKAGKVWIEIS